ncbi:hypothetical protein KJ678_03170 [Patescibacteria group bacterium]|nr:hypothetical protein [Patescibacteria group bacterium]
MKKQKDILKSLIPFLSLFLIGIIVGGTAVNVYFNFKQQKKLSKNDPSNYQADVAAYLKFKDIKESFMPSGIPEVYGQKLGISFDNVQDAINKISALDPTYGKDGEKIALTDLTPSELERYKKVGVSIACEYCCGVKTLTQEDGTAACGCAHSQMMRGLSAYLIKNNPDVSNDWILEELNKWKRTYFPKQTLSAELDKLAKSGEPGMDQLLKEFPDFLPQMVGGC